MLKDKFLFYYGQKIKNLNNFVYLLIKKNIWPFTNFIIKQTIINLIKKIQFNIAYLKAWNKSKNTFHYLKCSCFSLINCLLSIERIRTQSLQVIFKANIKPIEYRYNFEACFFLIFLICFKCLKIGFSPKLILYTKLKKKEKSAHNLIHYVFQLQILTFFNSWTNILFSNRFYNFCKEKHYLSAINSLSKIIKLNNTYSCHLMLVDIWKHSDFALFKLVLKKLPPLLKHKKILERLIDNLFISKCNKKMFTKVKNEHMFASEFILHNYMSIYIIKYLLENIYLSINSKNKIQNFINFEGSLAIKLTDLTGIEHTLKKLTFYFFKVNLILNTKKIGSYNFSTRIKFDWLGYTFLIIKNPKKYLNKQKRPRKTIKSCKIFVSIYMTFSSFIVIKKALKKEIKKLKHNKLLQVFKKILSLWKAFKNKHGFIENKIYFNSLKCFIYKVFWKILVEKFRYKGVRRTNWIAKNFFITTVSPLNLKWHLHFSVFKYNNLKKTDINVFQNLSLDLLSFKLQSSNIYSFPTKK